MPSRLALALLAAAVGLPLAWAGWGWLERRLIFFPDREFSIIPATFGLAHEEVSLTARDGARLHGWFLPEGSEPAPLAGRGLVLLYCHGNAGNISSRMHKVAMLHRLGAGVLLFDYRGYGKSEGRPSEAGTYRDAEAAWRWLVEAKGFAPERVVLYGESLGNAVAVETALNHPP
ncbi:MAG: alpha/beta fold hydrolase, partial [Elusimicrobia bacterium]|nr:alpha/beta fold hydrolase [Elusimicrobiota bacterium]